MVEARSVNVKKTTTIFQSTGEFVLKRALTTEIQTPHGVFIGKSVRSKPSEHPRRPGELCRYVYLGIFRCSRGLAQNENDVYVKVVPGNHAEIPTKQFKACEGEPLIRYTNTRSYPLAVHFKVQELAICFHGGGKASERAHLSARDFALNRGRK